MTPRSRSAIIRDRFGAGWPRHEPRRDSLFHLGVGTDLSDEGRDFIETLESRLAADESRNAALRANTRENARLTFDHVVESTLQCMVDTNFDFYTRVTDDREFSKFFLDWLFERFAKSARN